MAGIHAEIAEAKYKYWSTLAPNPIDVVLTAGEKAKEETGIVYHAGRFFPSCFCCSCYICLPYVC